MVDVVEREMASPGRKRDYEKFAADLVENKALADASAPCQITPEACHNAHDPPALCEMANPPASPDPSQLSSVLTQQESSTRSLSGDGPHVNSPLSTPGDGANDVGAGAIAPGRVHGSDRPGSSKAVTKRKRLSPEEKEAREKELAKKRQEREEEAQRKREEKAKQEEEKKAKARDRKLLADEKIKTKDEQKLLRARERDEKRKEKEEEQKRLQEEQQKKLRSQPKLNNFFSVKSTQRETALQAESPRGSPKKTPEHDRPSPAAKSAYQQLFQPFYIKPDVRMAKPLAMADEESRADKVRRLEISVVQAHDGDDQCLLDGSLALRLPWRSSRRGRLHQPVRHIMEVTPLSGGNGLDMNVGGIDAISKLRDALAAIPMKTIAFSQDVRPPYRGTVTLQPYMLGREGMVRLARRPTHRRLPLQYDYDSEAEWQEDEGEDVDVDDDEEEVDGEDDMDGFLDDSEEQGLPRRVFAGTMEPESTGLCFEAGEGCEFSALLRSHRLEFLTGFSRSQGVDPWTAKCWQQEPARNAVKLAAPADHGVPAGSPRADGDAFAVLRNQSASPVRLVKSELLNDIKKAILDNKALSKVGMVDIIFHQFRDSVSRLEVRNTIELVAEKKGIGCIKLWGLKPGHGITL